MDSTRSFDDQVSIVRSRGECLRSYVQTLGLEFPIKFGLPPQASGKTIEFSMLRRTTAG